MKTALIFAFLGTVIQSLFIKTEHDEKYIPADILKGSASLCFVLIGLIAFRQNPDSKLARLIFIGLVMGMLGDILLNMRFIFKKNGQKIFLVGILAFLIGHIIYLAAIVPYGVNTLLCTAIGTVVAASLLIYIFRTMEVKTAFKIFGVVYLGAVIIMTCIAIGTASSIGDTRSLMYAVGAILFTVSDIVLIFNTFSGTTKFSLRITNLSLYYIGQLFIAFSIFFI